MKGQLTVDRREFYRGLKRAAKTGAARGQPAQLTYAQGELRVAYGGHAFTLPAEGNWSGEVTVAVELFRKMAKTPMPGGPRLEISVDGDEIRFDILIVPCQSSDQVQQRIELPLGCQPADVLALTQRHDAEELKRSGLAEIVAKAERKRCRAIERAAAQFAKGAQWLQDLGFSGVPEKLGVDAESLRARVDAWIDARAKGQSGLE